MFVSFSGTIAQLAVHSGGEGGAPTPPGLLLPRGGGGGCSIHAGSGEKFITESWSVEAAMKSDT